MGLLCLKLRAKIANSEEHEEASQSNSCVKLDSWYPFQGLKNDFVRRRPSIDTADAQAGTDLGGQDCDCCSSNEGGNWNVGYELNQPA